MPTIAPTNAMILPDSRNVQPTAAEPAPVVVPPSCIEVIAPADLLGRIAQNTTGHVRASLHLRPTKLIAMPKGPPLRVRMAPKPRAALLMDFENIDGKLKMVGASLGFKQPIVIKNLGSLQGAHGLRKFFTNKLASFELTGFRVDASGTLKPQGTVLIAKRFATHRYDASLPTFNLNDMPKRDLKKGLSRSMYRTLQTVLNTVSSGKFKMDTKSRLGEDVLLNASEVAQGNETYVGIGRTAISGDVQGRFKTAGQVVDIELFPPQRPSDRTMSCNTAELDLRAHLQARLESGQRKDAVKGQTKNVLGIGIYADDAVASIRHLDLGLRGDPKAATNSGRVVGGTAWRPCQTVPAVVITLETLKTFMPNIGPMLVRGHVDADAALSFVEPVDPEQVLAAHTRGLQLAYDGRLDALGDITFTQPSGDPAEPPSKLIQHVKVVQGVNMSGGMEPMDEEPGVEK